MKVKVKLKQPILGLKPGTEVEVMCDAAGVPTEYFWRNRFQDSLKDNCLEIIVNSENIKHNKPKVEKLNKTETYSNDKE
jgi:hypothetical protein